MTSAPDGSSTAGHPGGLTAAGAVPAAGTGVTVHGLEEAVHQLEAEAEDRPPAAGAPSNLAVAAVVVALGAGTLVGSWSLGVGTPRAPGPGAWPFLVGAVLVVLGVALALLARTTTDAERFTRTSWAVPAGLATMVLFVAVIGVIGFEIPAALLSFVWLRFLGREGWRTSLITSIAVVAAFYLIFVAALAVPIPHLF